MKILTRRRFVRTSLAFGAAATLLPACTGGDPAGDGDGDGDAAGDGDGDGDGGPAGTLEDPFTAAAPGPWGDKIDIHTPTVWGALVDASRVRLWVEVTDETTGMVHAQTPDHYVQRLVICDQDDNILHDQTVAAGQDARAVITLTVGPSVTQLRVFEDCNLHGVWLNTYDVTAVNGAPDGSRYQPLTADQPGDWPDKIAVHVPTVVEYPSGNVDVEIGNRAADKLHVMTPEHYIDAVVVLDQDSQILADVTFTGNDLEPVVPVSVPSGTTSLRVVASCNLHDWWEAVFTVS